MIIPSYFRWIALLVRYSDDLFPPVADLPQRRAVLADSNHFFGVASLARLNGSKRG